MPPIARVAQEQAAESNNWMIYLLMLVAGLLVGGAWSAYKSDNKFLTVIMAVLAAVATVGAVMWLIGAMT
ncbi:hypothetical protein COCCU_09150 [Corynebacterium occultum]|uniref:Uncharacterized protein n=1 Tax=Corynebacterium occultum TaxID=2675219 RepID=A0A6B8W2N8_9CORY|nr:hypothetical protein [Corynebacterium occultum]QGU07754.1 hypothetical protein COCCU_09150 [Corynebacterium occultum]